MTMHYELKGGHEVCFKAIGLTGLIVNSKANNFNSKARTTAESKDLRCP